MHLSINSCKNVRVTKKCYDIRKWRLRIPCHWSFSCSPKTKPEFCWCFQMVLSENDASGMKVKNISWERIGKLNVNLKAVACKCLYEGRHFFSFFFLIPFRRSQKVCCASFHRITWWKSLSNVGRWGKSKGGNLCLLFQWFCEMILILEAKVCNPKIVTLELYNYNHV